MNVKRRLDHLYFWMTTIRAFGIFGLINVGSYFVLSSGHGIVEFHDGVVKFGFPFVMFIEGGLAGIWKVKYWAIFADILIGLLSSMALAFWWVTRVTAADDRE